MKVTSTALNAAEPQSHIAQAVTVALSVRMFVRLRVGVSKPVLGEASELAGESVISRNTKA